MSEITKSHCNTCTGERNHVLLHTEKESKSQRYKDGITEEWTIEHDLLKCCGCEEISYRCRSRSLEDPPGSIECFPPRVVRRPPAWLSQLCRRFPFDNNIIPDLFHELYVVIQNDCRRAGGMIVRALLEQIMIDEVGDQRTFAKNLAEFEAKGFISRKQTKILETVLEVGHATMHRAYDPPLQDLVALVEIAESVVESVYVNTQKVAQLKKRIPARSQ